MNIGGVNPSYATQQYGAASKHKAHYNSTAAASPAAATRDAADISPEAAQKAAQREAERAFAGAPSSVKELEELLEQNKKQFEELMNKAAEESEYDGSVGQSMLGTLYRVGPYAVYCQETGEWQWHNEDGTRRDGRPDKAEFDEQMQRSEEKFKNHHELLRENNHYDLFKSIARDAVLLNMTKSNTLFRELYESDPDRAVQEYSDTLLDSYRQYNYVKPSPDAPGRFFFNAE